MAKNHALLSPSSSARWINCTPSARLEAEVEDKGSEFAEEGTCAHALCECKLKRLLGEDDTECTKEFEALKDKWFTPDMDYYTDDYVSHVWGHYQAALLTDKRAKLLVEQKLDFSSWIPESFGTADAEIVTEKTLEVIDFKYGRGVEVSALDNTQMMIYALGALGDYDLDYDIQAVSMTIIQPRLSNYSTLTLEVEKLKAWADSTLKQSAKMAFEGKGEQNVGPWCRFCRVKARCTALANKALSTYTKHEDKTLLTDDEMSVVLGLVPAIKTWCTSVEDYATAQAISGHKWKGYKLVEGRSVRKITDTETLSAALLDAGYADIWKPQELRAIGELEKYVGKKVFAELSAGCVEKPAGKPTLVAESDKRPEMNINSAAEDFKDIQV